MSMQDFISRTANKDFKVILAAKYGVEKVGVSVTVEEIGLPGATRWRLSIFVCEESAPMELNLDAWDVRETWESDSPLSLPNPLDLVGFMARRLPKHVCNVE